MGVQERIDNFIEIAVKNIPHALNGFLQIKKMLEDLMEVNGTVQKKHMVYLVALRDALLNRRWIKESDPKYQLTFLLEGVV